MPKEPTEAIKIIEAARIPRQFHETRLNSVDGGSTLVSYLNSQQAVNDRVAGIGVNLYSRNAIGKRIHLFPLFARACALLEYSVFYVSMLDVLNIADEAGHPLAEKIMGVDALFVTGMYDPSVSFPFTSFQRYLVEELLNIRLGQNLRNYYSCAEEFQRCDWWSAEFRERQCAKLRQFAV